MKSQKKQHKSPRKKTGKKDWVINDFTFHKLDWLEWVSLILGLWFIVVPIPYILLFTILLCIPVLGIILNGIGKPSIASLVEVTRDDDGDKKYDVADFIDLPAWAILLRVLLDFEFEDFYSLVIPGTIASVGMIIILLLTHKRIGNSTKNKWWIYGSLVANICIYSYAGTYGVNCVYDTSAPEVYEAEVIEKRISRSKTTRYYVRVTPWGHRRDTEELRVSYERYADISEGQTVKIALHRGVFNIPWYRIER